MMMMKHGPRDREFIEAVVERGHELVRPIDLARMMRSGEEWASEDHGVIFYRLVRVLNGARAIAPDETEFGRRDDVARDVQQAMTHAAELGFVVLHEGKAYTDHMHEITIPNGTRFGTVSSVGTEGHQRDMVRKIEINKVKNGKPDPKETKKKVCCPVFVSGDTRFLVRCIGTMRNTETPVQVEGVHLTERLVCKHVTLYHPVSWPRRKQDLCAGHSKNNSQNKEQKESALQNTIDKLNEEEQKLETNKTKLGNLVTEWDKASNQLVEKARSMVTKLSDSKIVDDIRKLVESYKDKVLREFENADTTKRSQILNDNKRAIESIRNPNTTIKNDYESELTDLNKIKTDIDNFLRDAVGVVSKVSKEKAEYKEYMTSLSTMMKLVTEYERALVSALRTLDSLQKEWDMLAEYYEKREKNDKPPSGLIAKLISLFTNVDAGIDITNTGIAQTKVIPEDVGPIESSIDSYKKEQVKLKEQLVSEIDEINKHIETKRAKAEEKKKEQETKKLKNQEEDQAETQEQAGSRDEPDLNTTQVPHDADMCVAVQVSGELFRIVHLTRDVETQHEKKAKREEAEGEEAKKTKKTKRAQKEEKAEKAEDEEIKKYDDAVYAKKMKKDGDKHKVRLDADYDDYKECVSAARKYLEKTCIVNDTTESWSSAAWRLTKECREEASGTSGTSGSANFGHLEASDRLELVLVPRNLFGHVYGKGHRPTYDGNAEISKDGIWIYEADGPGKVCPKCAVCEKSEHNGKKNKSGLFVLYNKSDKDRIRGLSSRFCFHRDQ
jgi:hypothetical protein